MTTASEKQAARRAELTRHLLHDHGAVDVEGLAALRTIPLQDATEMVTHLVETHHLFSVNYAGDTLYPLVQFHDDGSLNEQVAAMVNIFLSNPQGKQGWALWAWLCVPTGLLSGEIPSEVVVDQPERAFRAAKRSAAMYRDREEPGT